MHWQHIVDLLHDEMASGVVTSSLARLVLAALLGGIIGLERELKHRPAGLRTNMFICFGAAMFTVLSDALAVEYLGDHTRISAQIIPGIGFIGAGSILHLRGLTTGSHHRRNSVCCGVGRNGRGRRPLPDRHFRHLRVLIALFSLGHLERTFNLKTLLICYEVTGGSVEEITRRSTASSSMAIASCKTF